MKNTNDISYILRLRPGNDLRLSIEKFAAENDIKAGWIVTGVGSLTGYSIRFANKKNPVTRDSFFEIISLSGTVSVNGCHLHISIADDKGTTIGGHLLNGCIIYTTAEIVVTESAKYIFKREKDDVTGWKELRINPK
jgi:uncharacterized protein